MLMSCAQAYGITHTDTYTTSLITVCQLAELVQVWCNKGLRFSVNKTIYMRTLKTTTLLVSRYTE